MIDIDTLPAYPQVEITYYTDPLCCWSWAFEPEWRRLRYEFEHQLAWRYCMGGMIPDWNGFNDPLNSVSRPAQMGPHWYQVRYLSGMPIDEHIWIEDPPDSSYPACIAVKAAERQGPTAGEIYLRRLREAVMTERRNIARRDVLVMLARELAPTLEPEQFERDLADDATLDALREDLKDVQYRGIGRFPTLIFRSRGGRAVITVGYRPYDVLLAVLGDVAPDLRPLRVARNAVECAQYWGHITTREVAEGLELKPEAAEQALESAVVARALTRQEVAHPGRVMRYYAPAPDHAVKG